MNHTEQFVSVYQPDKDDPRRRYREHCGPSSDAAKCGTPACLPAAISRRRVVLGGGGVRTGERRRGGPESSGRSKRTD